MKVNQNHIVKLQDKDFITYDGLLEMAHQIEGFKGIETEMILRENGVIIFKAIARTDKQEFYGHGDASPNNVNKMIAPHAIRMAETRAKARALRDLTNVGMCSVEELGGEDIKDTEPEKPKIVKGNGNSDWENAEITPEDVPESFKQAEEVFDNKPQKKSEYITDKQQKRLFALAGIKEDKERAKTIVKELLDKYKIESTGEIKKSEYEEICQLAEEKLAEQLTTA